MATGCVPISGFVSLVGTSIGVANFAVTLKIYETTAGIEKNKLIIKKRKRKHDKIVLLGKTQNL